MLSKFSKLYALALCGLISLPAAANQQTSIDSLEGFLLRFHHNPRAVMDELPALVKPDGEIIRRGSVPFGESDISLFHTVSKHSLSQDWVVSRSTRAFLPSQLPYSPLSAPDKNDQARSLVYLNEGQKLVTNLSELHKLGLAQGRAGFATWSDSYWPTYKGVIGRRYADPSFPNSDSWFQNYSHINYNPASGYVPARINELSPAEKYDLLVGDASYGLSSFVWARGKKSYDKKGFVAHWEGICHGWAAASHMNVPVPQREIQVTGVGGHTLSFNHSDLKGLVSYLWAESSPSTRFTGTRCRTTNPEKDEIGRINDLACFDNNPATWHTIITNQVGVNKKSFVMDSTYDTEVWNYPVQSYKITYFNPQSLKPSSRPELAAVPLTEYSMDKFSSYRTEGTAYVVGVAMDVTHAGAIEPKTTPHGEEPLVSKSIRYVYDLELDADMNIIGGEWYSNVHPDFVWTFEPDGQAQAAGDRNLADPTSWDTTQPLPQDWAASARRSAQSGKILASIVNKLLAASQVAEDAPPEGGESPPSESPEP